MMDSGAVEYIPLANLDLSDMSSDEEEEKTLLIHGSNHCHKPGAGEMLTDRRARCKLITACVLTLVFMIIEIAGGIFANSLAIATDAAHMLTDLTSYMISLLAMYLATKPASKRMTFGWHRAEIMGAVLSILMIWVVTGILIYMAVHRVVHREYDIEARAMLVTSALGVTFNIVMLATLHQHSHSHGTHGHSHTNLLHHHSHHGHSHGYQENNIGNQGYSNNNHGHSHGNQACQEDSLTTNYNNKQVHDSAHNVVQTFEGDEQKFDHSDKSVVKEMENIHKDGHKKKHRFNINVQAAFIHVIGDIVQSTGVFVAALVIFFKPEYKLADPICTFIFSLLVFATTVNILRETLAILLEAVPGHLAYDDISGVLCEIPGVQDYHNLRLWSLTNDRTAASVHLALGKDVCQNEVVNLATVLLREDHGIQEVTIQTELYCPEMKRCKQCQPPL